MNRFETPEGLDPALVVRQGRFDPLALLILWCGRKAFFPLLWLGFLVLTITGGTFEDLTERSDSLSELVEAVFSPLVGVLAAILMRIAVGWMAFFLAYPLSRGSVPADYAYGGWRSRSRFRFWQDRYYRTRAYTALRWTWAVRSVAIDRLGETGRALSWCDPILRWLGILLFALFAAFFAARIA